MDKKRREKEGVKQREKIRYRDIKSDIRNIEIGKQ